MYFSQFWRLGGPGSRHRFMDWRLFAVSTQGARNKRARWAPFRGALSPPVEAPQTPELPLLRPCLLLLWALGCNIGILVTHRYSVYSNLCSQKYSRQKLSIVLIYVHCSYLESYSSVFGWRWMHRRSIPLWPTLKGQRAQVAVWACPLCVPP